MMKTTLFGILLLYILSGYPIEARASDLVLEQYPGKFEPDDFLPSFSNLYSNADGHPLFFDNAQSSTQAGTPSGKGADGGYSSEELAKKLANPVADFINFQFQFNADAGIGPKHSWRQTLNIQPVIPITLNSDWNLITRTILPVAYQESPALDVSSQFGLGDTVQSFFFSPSHGSPLWGIGPVFLWPTATDDFLGSGKWGAGPTGVVLQQTGHWTYGLLANHIWSCANTGSSDRRSVNATFLEPFITYTTPTATSFTVNTESTYDWTDHHWTVPINAGVSQLLLVDGKLPVQVGLFGRVYLERPAGGPDWGARLEVTILLPR